MELSKNQLIENLEHTKNYLAQKVDIEPNYNNLIQTLNSTIETLQIPIKPVVKFVSSSVNLVTKLKEQSEGNKVLRSLYEFQAISPIQQLNQIVKNCDVICLIYNSKHNIVEHHQKLIELAQQHNISLILLVIQPKSDRFYLHLSDWLTAQNYAQVNKLLLAWENFGNLENFQDRNSYQQLLIQLSSTVKVKSEARIFKEIIPQIKEFFYTEITNNEQVITKIKTTPSSTKSLFEYQQKNQQVFNKIKQEIQQFSRITKQIIQQSRNDYLNPFMLDSWMFNLQEVIQSSQVKITSEMKETYAYLTVENDKNTEYLHSYILSIYQQKVIDTLASQWSKINYAYGEGGLQALVEKINTELETFSPLYLSKIEIPKLTLITESKPSLDLAQIIDEHCLKKHSRIPFEYNYTQSNWFRLLISGLIGLGIYLITKLYLGTGKYIGFFILIFQIINLLTGQNIKKIKIKQHQKELKRIVDNKYQNLIRIIVEKSIQTLINSLEAQIQLYQQQINAIEFPNKSEKDQIIINQHKFRINNLQQDQEKILVWFDEQTISR
jgi:hypothetical protein